MATTEAMDDLKQERSSLKRKITVISTRLQKAIQKDLAATQIQTIYTDLENIYLDYLSTEDEYSQSIDDDPTLEEAYAKVSDMDLQEYAATVEKTYSDAKDSFIEYDTRVKELETRLEQQAASKGIAAGVKVIKQKLRFITRRDSSDIEEDTAELMEDKEEVENLLQEIQDMITAVENIPNVDWTDIKSDLENLLEESAQTKRNISVKIRRKAEPSGVYTGGAGLQTAQEGDSGLSLPDTGSNSQSQTCASHTTAMGSQPITVFSNPAANHFSYSPGSTLSRMSTITSSVPKLLFPPGISQSPYSDLGLVNTGVSLQSNITASQPPVSFTGQASSGYPVMFSSSGPLNGGVSQPHLVSRQLSSGVSCQTSEAVSQLAGAGQTPALYPSLGIEQHSPAASLQSMIAGYQGSVPTTGNVQSAANLGGAVGPNQYIGHPQYQGPEIKVKRTELPTFDGSYELWPQFKVLWPKLALPAFKFDEETLANQLKNHCLTGTAAERVKSCSTIGPTAFTTMWQRLLQCFDDPATAVRAALKRLQKLKAVREEDYRGLTYLVDEVESCYSQLTTLNQLSCLSMRDVDTICELLPLSARSQWNRDYHRLPSGHQLHPFPAFMAFLDNERKVISRLVDIQDTAKKKREVTSHHASGKQERRDKPVQQQKSRFRPCAVHKSDASNHGTEECIAFRKLSQQEKLDAMKDANQCFRCFQDHRRNRCPQKDPCASCGNPKHHTLLCRSNANAAASNQITVPSTTHHAIKCRSIGIYAIFGVPVGKSRNIATVFTDDGSDSSYITKAAAKRLGAHLLCKFMLQITTTGGVETECESSQYELDLITKSGRKVTVTLFSLEKITEDLSKLDLKVIHELFPEHNPSILQRPSEKVDILLGTDFFGLHPKNEVANTGDNLSIMSGALGVCLQGSHPLVKAVNQMHSNSVKVLKAVNLIQTVSNLTVCHPLLKQYAERKCPVKETQSYLTKTESERIDEFILGAEQGAQVIPGCGGCRCGKCPSPGHTFSFEEESELKVIRDNLKYDEEMQCWRTSYPWKKDPRTLPNNRSAVLSTLHRMETKLRKDKHLASVYHNQIIDMLDRGVAREVSQEELNQYDGPYFYISHLGVPNPRSDSTPYRIVFNSSQVYKTVSLNSYLYKGPDAYLNGQQGILLRWREGEVAITGDIRKMYNSVHLELVEQHTHRFLWGNLQSPPKTYVMTRVNMGDRPAGAISTEALYKTADMFASVHPRAAIMLKAGTYVDDVIDSVESQEEAKDVTEGAGEILHKGGFNIKFWLCSGQQVEKDEGVTQVLGLGWNPEKDLMICQASLNFSPKKQGVHISPDLKAEEVPQCIPKKLSKRMVLAQVMRLFDPLGLVTPFIIQGRILLRRAWELKLGWDDSLPTYLQAMWLTFLTTLYEINDLHYPRVLKPVDSIGSPSLIIFSDASDLAYGAAAYIRWKRSDDTFWNRLIMSKSYVTPLRKRTTPQLELNAAVLSKRMREVIQKEMRYQFEAKQILHIMDSETVMSMIHKTSTRFKLYEGIRISEIQAATNGDLSCWSWIAGEKNISDVLTRGKNPSELGPDSDWFNGPPFMKQPIEEWGLKFSASQDCDLPGEKKVMNSHATVRHTEIMQYNRSSSYRKILRILARILNMFTKKSFLGAKDKLTPTVLERAEHIVIRNMQLSISTECYKRSSQGKVGGKFCSLKPALVEDLWVVGSRFQFNPMVPENDPQYLLPTTHPVTKLMMMQAHQDTGHRGRDSTLARFRQKFWIPQGSKIASSTVENCQMCKVKKPTLLTQRMGDLPTVRSKPAPPFTFVAVDYFGHFLVRGDIQKRVTGKAWGIIFTDLVSRAVFLEAVFGYDTASFLLALNKFASCRGYPREIYSDPGSNLVGASNELKEHWQNMWKEDADHISSETAKNGLEWKLSSADSPWRNGAVEALVKSCKQAISFSMGSNRLSPFEFSSALYDVANLINERPIGTISSSDSELSVITPNSLLIGRSQAKNPGGWQPSSYSKPLERFYLVQQITSAFWKQWLHTVAPGLITDAKWHSVSRNLQPGDVVLVVNKDTLKSEYRLALVKQTFPDSKGVVRSVSIMYKHYRVGERLVEYHGGGHDQELTRSVQRLALVVPVDSPTGGE